MTATSSRLLRGIAIYAAVSAALVVVAGGVFMLLYAGAAERMAVWTSAGVAWVIQLLAFALARLMAEAKHGIAGWGIGAMLSLLTLFLYGLIVRGTELPTGVALVSLATFLFITELIEPPLLNV